MQYFSKIFCQVVLIVAILFPTFSYAEYSIYYGTTPSYAKRTALIFDLMIVQPYNIDLYTGYAGRKICYLSVGEFAGTTSELAVL